MTTLRIKDALENLVTWHDMAPAARYEEMVEDGAETGLTGREYEDLLWRDARRALGLPVDGPTKEGE